MLGTASSNTSTGTGTTAPPAGGNNTPTTGGSGTTSPSVITCPDTCSWYQESVLGADSKCGCKFSVSNTAQTIFMLPGSVVAGFMVKPEPGQDKAILSQNMMVLATAISLVAWGGLAYYLWRRFR